MNTQDAPLPGGLMMNCRRYTAMIAWYRELLQAEVLHRDAMQCWLRSPRGWTLVLLDTQQAERPREIAGLDGLALQYERFEALSDAYAALAERGILPQHALKNGFVTTLMYRDPDGNRVSLRYLLPADTRGPAPYSLIGDEFEPAELFEVSS